MALFLQAVDIWAMGCVFFVFVNGIMAFDETVEQSVLLYNQRNRVYVWRNPRNHSPTAKRGTNNYTVQLVVFVYCVIECQSGISFVTIEKGSIPIRLKKSSIYIA